MRLRMDDFELPAQAGLDRIEAFQVLAKKAAKIGDSSGKMSRRFETRCVEIRKLSEIGGQIEDFTHSKLDVRVVLFLWKTDDAWRNKFQPNSDSLRYLEQVSHGFRPARLLVLQDIYFTYFDELEDLDGIGQFLSRCLSSIGTNKLRPNQQRLYANRETALCRGGPNKIAREAISRAQDLGTRLDEVGLSQYRIGRFARACKSAYYVETVRSIRIGAMHDVLSEIESKEIRESSYDGRLNLGQKIAQVLIRRCHNDAAGMPPQWLKYIKDLTCDPRVPVRSESYQKWWAAMDRKDEDRMRRWLAGADLRLFLDILKESSSDEDLTRMYPARRRFLEGLLDGNDVVDARLFLGERAQTLIRKQHGPEALEAHASLSDPHKTVIYMHVDNKVHFFEGTHNFAARGGGVLPSDCRVLSRSAKRFSYIELSTELDSLLNRAGQNEDPPLETIYVRHAPPIGWQASMLEEFRYYGVVVDPEKVFSSDDYKTYRRDYGI